MIRIFAAATFGLLGLVIAVAPANAAGGQKNPKPIDWNQHDTAVYVVSTLNVCHNRHGRPLTTILAKRLAVARYEVWDDLTSSDLYYIQLKRADGSVIGQLAYQMGWSKPMSLSISLDRFGFRHVPQTVADSYTKDAKQLIGSFTSTLPQ